MSDTATIEETTETTETGASNEAPVVVSETPTTETPATDATTAEAKPETPVVEYSLKLPEKSALAAESVERTVATARALGLSADAAQAVLELANDESSRATEAVLAAHRPGGAVWEAQAKEWREATLANPELGKTAEERQSAIQRGVQVLERFKADKPAHAETITSFLNETAQGNHPATVAFFAWLGEAMKEQPLALAGAQAPAARTPGQLSYPNTKWPNQGQE